MDILKKQYIPFIRLSCISIFTILLFSAQQANSQTTYKYWIELTDKNDSEYSIANPFEFLSERAIQRRTNQNISITESDLPVNASYIQQIKKTGVKVLYTSKWFNSLVIETDDNDIISTISQLDFVEKVELAASYLTAKSASDKFRLETEQTLLHSKSATNYGYSFEQINLHNGDWLHDAGFRGDGIHIAIIDAGFTNADSLIAFDSLRQTNRILGYKDFVNMNDSDAIFASHSHGTNVMSIIGTNLPNNYIGTAPNSSYWMLRTEDGSSEMRIEEMNWIAAAEFADSVGVDVINTSLGYSTFDIPTQDYGYEDMDGNSTYISRAAKIASSKGMLLVTSAGNSGNDPWYYITAPADADNILTIGAVNLEAEIAPFSSNGPSSDGRIKPDIVSVGYLTALVSTNGNFVSGNGTSFSAPMMTGLVSCLWQAFPNATNKEIINAIKFSSDRYDNPDFQYGYGIPDMKKAYDFLFEYFQIPESFTASFQPTRWGNYVEVKMVEQNTESLNFDVYDTNGKKIKSEKKYPGNHIFQYPLDFLDYYPVGIYFVKIQSPEGDKTVKVIR